MIKDIKIDIQLPNNYCELIKYKTQEEAILFLNSYNRAQYRKYKIEKLLE